MSVEHSSRCFHCNEPLLGSTLVARLAEREAPVCCAGCLAVAELIAGAGLGEYYQYRNAPNAKPDAAALTPDAWEAYAHPEVADAFVRRRGEFATATLLVDGLHCAACSWLIDRALHKQAGVREVSVNAASGRAYIEWEPGRLTLADLMRTVAQLGFRPQPLTAGSIAQAQQQERRSALKRLLMASFGMMQVMMFAASVYAAQLYGETMDRSLLEFFRLVSLLVATPVMLYAGAPFLLGAVNSLRSRRISMDAPVGLALALAYAASVWNTFTAQGEVYFDSVTMFVFFLTLGRFVTMSVRHRTSSVSDALARQLPALAHRLLGAEVQDVPATALQPGDRILVRAGEAAPADGDLIEGVAQIDESLLTGESRPVRRGVGERIAAGALNVEAPIQLRVAAVGGDTVLAHIAALLHRAQARKPAISCAADRAAARFLTGVLIGAAATCGVWLAVDPARAFEATLAVLVVACPCAFAIAMPAALAAATARLAQRGVLLTRPDALQSLAAVDRIVFDKTGTLTRGRMCVTQCTPRADLDEAHCRAIAAALERSCEHPLARAFAGDDTGLAAQNVRTIAGCGVEGVVNGRRLRIGSAAFVAELRADRPDAYAGVETGATLVSLGDEQQELACFELRDEVREDASAAIAALSALHVAPQILSGDGCGAVAEVAERCGVAERYARRSPQEKLGRVQTLQQAGARVAMVGDGLNDAPVLGAADASIAMGRGAALAHASADVVLVREDLEAIPHAIALARRTLTIARQNLVWSAVYNLASLPLAALGFIPPWLAALGMSLSSAAVVLNATRLLPRRQRADALAASAATCPPPLSAQRPAPSARSPSYI